MGDRIGATIEDITGLDVSNSSANDRALEAQQGASHEANELQRYMYDTTRKDNEPWRQAGVTALGGLANQDFQRDFTMADFQADPGFAFRMAEGQKAIERSAAARGGLGSGSTLKELTKYSQGVASDEFNNVYNRFNADRDRRFNRLASLAGIGQTANAANQQAGQSYANAYGENVTGAANAQAASAVAQANQRNALMEMGSKAYGAKGGGGSGGSGGISFSDIRVKTNVEPVSKEDLNELKAHLKAYKFNYLPGHGDGIDGDVIGVMAQDLEKSKLGKTLVYETPDGMKALDIRKVMMLFLATLAEG